MQDKDNLKSINKGSDIASDCVGNYSIQLFDAVTGELVQEVKGHNRVNPNLLMYSWNAAYGASLEGGANQSTQARNATLAISNRILTLYYSDDDPKSGYMEGPREGKYIGYGKVGEVSGDADRLSYNAAESSSYIYFDDDGRMWRHIHYVYDATTSQMNGEMNTILYQGGGWGRDCHTTASVTDACQIGYNHSERRSRPTLETKVLELLFFEQHPDCPEHQKNIIAGNGYYKSAFCVSVTNEDTVWIFPRALGGSGTGINYVDKEVRIWHVDPINKRVIEYVDLQVNSSMIGSGAHLSVYRTEDTFMLVPPVSQTFAPNDTTGFKNGVNMYIFDKNGQYMKQSTGIIGHHAHRSIGFPDGLLMCGNTENPYLVFDKEGTYRFRVDNARLTEVGVEPYGDGRTIATLMKVRKGWAFTYCNLSSDSAGNMISPRCVIYMSDGSIKKLDHYRDLEAFHGWAMLGFTANTTHGNAIQWKLGGFTYYLGYPDFFISFPRHWFNWCKLDAPVTKYSNCTMKVQFDVDIPVTHPGQIFKDSPIE